MTQAVIVSTARTPIGRAYKGAFNATKSPTLLGHAIAHAVARSGVEPGEIDDVVAGTVLAAGTAGMNLARNAAFAAGLGLAPLAALVAATTGLLDAATGSPGVGADVGLARWLEETVRPELLPWTGSALRA